MQKLCVTFIKGNLRIIIKFPSGDQSTERHQQTKVIYNCEEETDEGQTRKNESMKQYTREIRLRST